MFCFCFLGGGGIWCAAGCKMSSRRGRSCQKTRLANGAGACFGCVISWARPQIKNKKMCTSLCEMHIFYISDFIRLQFHADFDAVRE